MADDELNRLRQLLAAQQQQMAAQQEQMAAQQQRIEAVEEQLKKSENRREAAEKQLEHTDFTSFLSLCHHRLYSTLAIEEDSSLTATGKYTKVDGKFYPLNLKPWTSFPSLHSKYQARLHTTFSGEQPFPPSVGIDTMKKFLLNDLLATENDVRQFQSLAVDGCVKQVLVEYIRLAKAKNQDPAIKDLPETITFRDYPYGLFADPLLGEDEWPAYINAMETALNHDAERRGRQDVVDSDQPPPAKRVSSPTRIKLYPDMWLLRCDKGDSKVPILVVEYKAAHKMRASTVKMALRKRDPGTEGAHEELGLFAAAIREELRNKIDLNEDLRATAEAKKATARVLTQAFHYMIEFGLCYSYVTSAEVLILLHIDEDDPRTLYYHVSVPNKEVVSAKGPDNLECTAVASALTMALLALDSKAMSQSWKRNAQEILESWPTPYPEMDLESDSEGSGREGSGREGSDREEGKGLRSKGVLLPAPTGDQGCRDPVKPQRRRRKDDDDGDFNPPRGTRTVPVPPKTHTKRSRSRGGGSGNQGRGDPSGSRPAQYCSQACLLGLRDGGPLDSGCPNFADHLHYSIHSNGDGDFDGTNDEVVRHGLSLTEFSDILREQLEEDMDHDCEALDKFGKFGAIGMLFRLTLRGYGYCFVAKGVQRWHAPRLEHELGVYEHVRAQQGLLVPVCLGMIELVHEYWSSTGAHISHMLLLSYCGEPAFHPRTRVPVDVETQVENVWSQLKKLGINHGDQREPNVVWNAELGRVMCIDFDWARVDRKHEMEAAGGDILKSPKRQRIIESH